MLKVILNFYSKQLIKYSKNSNLTDLFFLIAMICRMVCTAKRLRIQVNKGRYKSLVLKSTFNDVRMDPIHHTCATS